MNELAAQWRRSSKVVALTGAGISTPSGIPDFRSPGGRWDRYQPVTIQEFMASEEKRAEYWRYKGETWQLIRRAEPNEAHLALTRLATGDALDLLVTQNVDGLHQRSGFPPEKEIDIHGTDARVVCCACGDVRDREPIQSEWEAGTAVPRCQCGGPWKPAVISFGQGLVEADLARAMREAASCDLFVAIGTSLVVGPVNRMFELAHRNGAATAILTASETPYDGLTSHRSSDPLDTFLPELARAILE